MAGTALPATSPTQAGIPKNEENHPSSSMNLISLGVRT